MFLCLDFIFYLIGTEKFKPYKYLFQTFISYFRGYAKNASVNSAII